MKIRPCGTKAVVPVLILILMTGFNGNCAESPLLAAVARPSFSFADDLEQKDLVPAVRHSLKYLCGLPPDRKIPFGGRTVSVEHLARSLDVFLSLVNGEPASGELDRLIREHFDIYQAGAPGNPDSGRQMLVTGYFQPIFAGSLTRASPYLHPLYAVPDDLVYRTGARGEKTAGRIRDDTFVPYWTRGEIELQGRAAGHELVWLKDPFDAFVLHVQGSGLIRLPDGAVQGVRFAARNGREYRSIGRLLVETGRLKLKDASLDSIRAYLAAHPGEQEKILHHNESFIFFSWAEHLKPTGNLGLELTAGRSAAVDQSFYPAGALAFLVSRKPSISRGNGVQWTPLHRFVLVQDTGSAMRGPGKVDLFWGTGPAAGAEAGRMKEKGELFLLLLKKQPSPGTASICSDIPEVR
ncbi:MAG TPA: transglycosylase [Desulfobacteraceae bacterium]|nr:transglycosylase [Desulfobacteraceae bacterium]